MHTTRLNIALAALLLLTLSGCGGCYNTMVEQQESVNTAWANVQSAYQRRADLVPNLVSTVRGAANFERETLEAVTNARSRATQVNLTAEDLADPEAVRRFQEAQAGLSQSLGRLLMTVESYPELRATESFRDLQAQLEGVENRINVARNDFNQAVRQYNTTVRSFPNVLLAKPFGFSPRTPFEADAGASAAPRVEF